MTYDEAQVVSQLVSMALFMALMVIVLVYALRKSNKGKFERASKLPLESDDKIQQR